MLGSKFLMNIYWIRKMIGTCATIQAAQWNFIAWICNYSSSIIIHVYSLEEENEGKRNETHFYGCCRPKRFYRCRSIENLLTTAHVGITFFFLQYSLRIYATHPSLKIHRNLNRFMSALIFFSLLRPKPQFDQWRMAVNFSFLSQAVHQIKELSTFHKKKRIRCARFG